MSYEIDTDDFESFDLRKQLVYVSPTYDARAILDALHRPMSQSTARSRYNFVSFTGEDEAFHVQTADFTGIPALNPTDYFFDAAGDRYNFTVAELQTGGARVQLVARKAADADPELRMHLKLNDQQGTHAMDETGNVTATLGGDLALPASSATGKVGSAYSFSGVVGGGGPRIILANPVAIQQINPLTIACWIRPADQGSRHLLDFGKMTLYLDAGRIALKQWFATTNGIWRIPAALTAGAWRHVAITYTRQSFDEAPAFYLDGVKTSADEVTTPAGAISTDIAQNKYIGNNAALGEPFSGLLDDFRIYGRTLTNTEIDALYQIAAIQPA